jgi:hypothetical protein
MVLAQPRGADKAAVVEHDFLATCAHLQQPGQVGILHIGLIHLGATGVSNHRVARLVLVWNRRHVVAVVELLYRFEFGEATEVIADIGLGLEPQTNGRSLGRLVDIKPFVAITQVCAVLHTELGI